MHRRKKLIVVITLMLLFTFVSCNHSTSGPQDVIRKITIIGDYSLAGIPSEVKNGTVITFPEKIINGHSYTATIANRPYSAGEKYTVNSDIIINLLLNHEYTQWTNDGKSTHVRHCTVEGCSNIEIGYHTIENESCTLCGYHPNGKAEQRINPANIENGETVTINKEDCIVYSIVTNFMSGYSTSKEYEGDEFKVEATVINDITWSRSRNLSSTYSAINISKPYQDEYGYIKWDGMYVYDNDKPEQKDMKEIQNSEDIITGRDYDNGLLYIIDKNVSDNDLEMVNEILNCLYYDEDSLMEDNYLEKEQEMLKTKPSEKYLFPMKDSKGNNHRLFTIAIYDFNEEDIGTLGYFSSEPYNSQSSRNAYAAFYMNLSSIRNNYNESGAKAAAESFLKTFAHEYTHYLQVDRKHNTAYMETIDLAHFLEEGIADYISLKQNGLFEREHGAYNEEQGYINMMFDNSKTYHPRCQEYQICNYGIGCMFWSYIEEKYQDYGGMDVVINLTRQDTDTLEAVERELKKPFNEVYEDFMLEIIAEALGVDEINGIKRDMKFPELYEVKRIYDEAITYTNDADKTDMNVNLGPMSFSIIRYYDKLPNSLTFASESADAKCYLVFLD